MESKASNDYQPDKRTEWGSQPAYPANESPAAQPDYYSPPAADYGYKNAPAYSSTPAYGSPPAYVQNNSPSVVTVVQTEKVTETQHMVETMVETQKVTETMHFTE